MKSENNLTWLLIAVSALGFTFWYQEQSSDRQSSIQQVQKDFSSCQSEFKAFKDGLTYGRK
ncbi:MAG: hypothetical protein HWQ38_27110 [Nostoc sp. NMS7]|uniref:hypothetical protein n=1 Tax=Nostoc sp. NMS7 TaxID=2815391 RepID=UPI0025E8BC08|nr:hypothetical protein [Nostoc sp. NMS7]MBN3949942.1 hypothetical protein [Nostoc sp. NMS7]